MCRHSWIIVDVLVEIWGAWTYLLELYLRTFGLMYCIHLWLKDKYNPLITDFMNLSKS